MILTTPAQEKYTRFSCPNPHCARFNRPGAGNIAHRSWTGTHKHIERLRCTAWDPEFSEREGTPPNPPQPLVYLSVHVSRPCWIDGRPLISMIGLSHDEDTFCLYAAPLLVKPSPIE